MPKEIDPKKTPAKRYGKLKLEDSLSPKELKELFKEWREDEKLAKERDRGISK